MHGRGNISLEEKNKAIAEVEKFVLGNKGLKTVYTRIGEQPRGSSEITEDTIGIIQFEFADWKTRASAHEIMDQIRKETANIPGILAEVTGPRAGPPTGKPVQIQLGALDPELLPAAAKKVAAHSGAAPRHPRSRRRPAAARHRLAHRGRQGGSREIRRRASAMSAARCSSSPTA